jgi:murein DD-endopeptidase MepM/ murein hydrolase activator NlpD
MRLRAGQALVLVLALALLLPTTALAKRKSEAELRSELQTLKAQTAAAGRAFDKAYWRLDEADVRYGKVSKRIGKTEAQLKVARRRLNRHAEAMYRHDQSTYLEFILGSLSFEQLVTRYDYLKRIGLADAAAVTEVELLRARLLREKEDLRQERSSRAKALSRLRKERDRLAGDLRSRDAAYRRVKDQLDALRGGRSPGIRSLPGPNGMVFPVVGSNYYANTWGASRSGGRRRHKGTDIMARRGTPVVAVSSGTVTTKSGGLGGRTVWLHGSNGWTFYYAHLDRYAVSSGSVRAGQVVGYVGATGNAAGGSPHLHFEIHPGGRRAINPYSYLRSME